LVQGKAIENPNQCTVYEEHSLYWYSTNNLHQKMRENYQYVLKFNTLCNPKCM